MVRLKLMPTCRICTQNYPLDQFVSGNGPRYQVCVRCAVDNDLVDREDAPQLYSDDIVKARTSLFARRYRMWIFVLLGWPLYLTLGRGIELWSSVFLVVRKLFHAKRYQDSRASCIQQRCQNGIGIDQKTH